MRGCGKGFQGAFHGRRQPTQRSKLRFVGSELNLRRELAMDQEMGDLFEGTGLGNVEDVVSTIVQIVATAPDGAKGSVAGGHARQRNGLLRGWRARSHLDPPE